MQVNVAVDAIKSKRIVLRSVTNVVAIPNVFGTVDVTGTLTNPYAKALAGSTAISAVVFVSQGNVIGGGNKRTLAEIQAGASVGFRLSYFDLFPTPAGTSTHISINPCGGFTLGCSVLSP